MATRSWAAVAAAGCSLGAAAVLGCLALRRQHASEKRVDDERPSSAFALASQRVEPPFRDVQGNLAQPLMPRHSSSPAAMAQPVGNALQNEEPSAPREPDPLPKVSDSWAPSLLASSADLDPPLSGTGTEVGKPVNHPGTVGGSRLGTSGGGRPGTAGAGRTRRGDGGKGLGDVWPPPAGHEGNPELASVVEPFTGEADDTLTMRSSNSLEEPDAADRLLEVASSAPQEPASKSAFFHGIDAGVESKKRPKAWPAPAASGAKEAPKAAASSAAQSKAAADQARGVRLLAEGRFQEARETFARMLEGALEAGLKREEGQALLCIGTALDKSDAPGPEVDEAYKQALVLAHKQDDMELSFNVLSGMGIHAVKTEDLDLAEHFHLQALTLAKRVLTGREEGIAEGHLGRCLAQSPARRAECFGHFKSAISLTSDLAESASLRAELGFALAAAGGGPKAGRKAAEECQKALALARKAEDRKLEAHILACLIGVYSDQLGAQDKAAECRKAVEALQSDNSTTSPT